MQYECMNEEIKNECMNVTRRECMNEKRNYRKEEK